MGKKHRQKVLLVILVVIVSALAIFPLVFQYFNYSVNAESHTVTDKKEISGDVSSKQLDITYAPGVYMLVLGGQNGMSSSDNRTKVDNKNGLGAVCIGFFRTTSDIKTTQHIGYGEFTGKSGNKLGGGGYTYAETVNFALPITGSTGRLIAAGGGGAAYAQDSQTTASTINANWAHAFFSGVDDDVTSSRLGTYYGLPGRKNNHGTQGLNNSASQISQESALDDKKSYQVSSGSGVYATTTTKTSDYASGRGGAGHYNGGGGGRNPNSYTSYPGGGGVCSPNGYPVYAADSLLGVSSTGNGFFNVYRLDPVAVPSKTDGTVSSAPKITEPALESNRYTPGGAYSPVSGYIKTGWVYKIDGGTSGWQSLADVNAELAKMTAGSDPKTVTCKYVIYAVAGTTTQKGPSYNMQHTSAASAADDSGYTIKQETIKVYRKANVTYTTPTAKSGLVYNNTDQVLISAGSATNGTMKYRLGADGSWKDSADDIKAKNPGTYKVYYKVDPSDSEKYVGLGATYINVTIAKTNPELNPGTLAPKSLVYNGASQVLFSGAATVKNSALDSAKRGTIQYADVWTSGEVTSTDKVPKPTKANSNAVANGKYTINDCVGSDSYNADGKPCYRYLWYKISGTDYHNAVDWTLLTKNDKPWGHQIQRVSLNLSASLMTSASYNGKDKQIISSVTKTTNSSNTNYANNFDITYTFNRTNANGLDMSDSSPNTSFTGSISSKIDVSASWKPKSNLDSKLKLQFKSGNKSLGTVNINQINDKNQIKVLGVPNLQNLGVNVKLNNSGTAQPFINQNVAVDLTVCGVSTYNGITTNNALQNILNSNKLAFGISNKDDPTSVSSWTSTTSASDLNTKIKNLTVNQSGMLYLHFKVLQHLNLKTGTMFNAASFYVEPIGISREHLTGITLIGGGKRTFNGASQVVASGYLRPVTAFDSVKLGTIKYALTTDGDVAPQSEYDWFPDVSDLNAMDAGKYYLWVKWSGGSNSEANSLVYGEITISSFDPLSNNNLVFTGADFTQHWPQSSTQSSFKSYQKKYNNSTNILGSMNNCTASILSNKNILSNEFGTLKFMYGSATAPSSDRFVTENNFQTLTIKDVGTYYLWVQWSGVKNANDVYNVKPGKALYKTSDSRIHIFEILKLQGVDDDVDTELVKLHNQNFVKTITNDGKVKYDYDFNTISEIHSAVGKAQPLFANAAGSVTLLINGKQYTSPSSGVSYYYLASNLSAGINSTNSGWQPTIGQAKATAVGTYYLWMKIVINDVNADIIKIVKLDCTAEIIAADSVVCPNCLTCKPRAKTDLKTNNQPQVLIEPGNQYLPALEYSLDGVTWYTNANMITGNAPRTYKVYYRGADYKDGSGKYIFKAVNKQITEYKYVEVLIQKAGIQFDPLPKSKGVVYNGKPQVTFTKGVGNYFGNNVELVYSWEKNGIYYSYEEFTSLDNDFNKTDVGSYTLWVDNETTLIGETILKPGEPISVTVEILRADIKLTQAVLNGDNFVYQGADYKLLVDDVNYGMLDGDNIIKVNDTPLIYENRNKADWPAGKMGKIWYTVTTSKYELPDANAVWTDSHDRVIARNVGDYYIWVKVDAGDFHNGISATCWNANRPITIAQLEQKTNGNKYQNVIANNSSYEAVSGLYYNGINQKLISELDLQIAVVARDDQGYVILKNGELADENSTVTDVEYNIVNLDELGTISYALIMPGNNLPGDYSDDWKTEWAELGQLNAGTYHLAVMFKGENFADSIKFNLSLVINGASEIKITPANKDNLQISGINRSRNYYTADAQVMATGDLVVQIDGNNVTNDVTKALYAYGAPGADLNTTFNWSNSLAEAKVTEVGNYQLYVKLQQVSGNISSAETIFPVFTENNYAEILRAKDVEIVAPEFVEGLTYNGMDQQLLSGNATLRMKNGKAISGDIGTVRYYISSSYSAIDKTGTTKEGKPLSLEEVQELHAGTYYILVGFDEGTSHSAIAPRGVGFVKIAQANKENISLSGIEFTKQNTYNGTGLKLIKSSVEQTLIATSIKLKNSDYEKIEYAYSNDPEIQPSSTADWVTDINDLCGRDAGNYYVWVRVTGKPNGVTDVNNIANYTKCYYITDQDYAEICRANISRYNLDGVSLHQNLVYTTQSQVLASIPEELEITFLSNQNNLNTPEYNNDLVILWTLSESETDIPLRNWKSNIQDLQGTTSGKYYLCIWIQESKNFNSLKCYYGEIEIGKAPIKFIKEPTLNQELTYKGDYQELVSSGPTVNFVAKGEHYVGREQYFNADEVVVEYSLDKNNWTRNYTEIKGLDAGEYTIYYRVQEADNWLSQEDSINVSISAIDASTDYLGVAEAPQALTDLHYNEKKQDLISFGVLSHNLPVAQRGAAWEGSRIVFYYADEPDKQYKYYFDKEQQKYVWDEATGKLPGKTDVGTYTIKYYISESESGNYYESANHFTIQISIAKREVYWVMNPQPVNNFRHTGEHQRIVVPGQLNAGITDPKSQAEGVKVLYSMQDPTNGAEVEWTETIPTVNTLGLFYFWYYVWVDDNNFFTGEESTPENAVGITTLVGRNMLSIVDDPRPLTLTYTAGAQSLVNYYYLSTDVTDAYGDKAPYIEYTFDPTDDSSWTREITGTEVKAYTIYYRLNYNNELFVFEGNDGHNGSLSITSEIVPARFATDAVQAEFQIDEEGNHRVTYKVASQKILNEETGEYEDVPLYSAELMTEVKDYIKYYYRKSDTYHVDQKWQVWTNGVSKLTDLANYEFKLDIVAPEGQAVNFVSYKQEGIASNYLNYTNAQNRTLKIIMQDFNTPAYVRCWIDLDGSMKYDDGATNFRHESFVGHNGTLEYTFAFVDSNGDKNNGQIRLDTPSTNTFYYVSDRALTYEERRKLKLESQHLNNAEKGFNVGLLNEITTVYLYEVYHIQYDNNYGIGDSLKDGWKWHGIEYRLEENKYQKFNNGVYLEPNGWNTSRSGNGNNYNGASMTYRENASQIFYAKFFGQDEKFYTIKWVIDDGVNKYTLSRGFMVWFDALNPDYDNRTTGTLVSEGDLITLPQVETDEFGESLADIFGGHVVGWYTADDGAPYTIGMTAVRDMTFIAELNSDIDEYVNCEFINADNKVVHESGKIASGSEAYMALSGMDANLIKDYQDGFNQWVEKYGYDYLDRADTTNGVFTYQLGAKTVHDNVNQNQGLTWADYLPMFIVLAVGIIPVITCLVVYLNMRRKQHAKNNN